MQIIVLCSTKHNETICKLRFVFFPSCSLTRNLILILTRVESVNKAVHKM